MLGNVRQNDDDDSESVSLALSFCFLYYVTVSKHVLCVAMAGK